MEQPTNKQLHNDIFTDLDNVTWARDAIVFLAEKKIINGKENYKYYPNDIITREEACKIIVLAFKLPLKDYSVSKFSDVSMWAQPYVEAAYTGGIVNGYDEYIFGGSDSITRQDLAVMIYRAMQTYGYEFEEERNETFIDASQIASYANEAVTALYAKGYINGVGNGYFSPASNASRAQIAQIVYNVIKEKEIEYEKKICITCNGNDYAFFIQCCYSGASGNRTGKSYHERRFYRWV